MPKTNKTAWKKAKTHEVTLNSGTEVSIQIPNLVELLQAGDVPNHLVPYATRTSEAIERGREIKPEQIKAAAEFARFLVTKTVVEPEVTPEDVPDLPAEDVDMLIEFATRQRDLDALGHHIAGLEKQSDFRSFRRLASRDAADLDFEGER